VNFRPTFAVHLSLRAYPTDCDKVSLRFPMGGTVSMAGGTSSVGANGVTAHSPGSATSEVTERHPGLLKWLETGKCAMYGSTWFCTAVLVSCPLAPRLPRGFSNYVLRGGRVRERGI
jgi:hypothetical protein